MDHLVLSAFPVAAPAIVAEPEGGRLFALALSLACCDADAPARPGEAGPVPHRPAGAGGVAMQASAAVHPSTPHPPRPAAGHAPAEGATVVTPARAGDAGGHALSPVPVPMPAPSPGAPPDPPTQVPPCAPSREPGPASAQPGDGSSAPTRPDAPGPRRRGAAATVERALEDARPPDPQGLDDAARPMPAVEHDAPVRAPAAAPAAGCEAPAGSADGPAATRPAAPSPVGPEMAGPAPSAPMAVVARAVPAGPADGPAHDGAADPPPMEPRGQAPMAAAPPAALPSPRVEAVAPAMAAEAGFAPRDPRPTPQERRADPGPDAAPLPVASPEIEARPVSGADRPSAPPAPGSAEPRRADAPLPAPPQDSLAAPAQRDRLPIESVTAAAGPSPAADAAVPPRDAPASPPARQVAPMAVALALTPQPGAGFALSLEPAELGRVEIRVARDGDRHSVHLVAERAETLALLQRDAPELGRSLAQAGIELSDGGVSFALAGEDSRGGDPGGGRRQPARRAEPGEEPTQRPLRLGLLDLHA